MERIKKYPRTPHLKGSAVQSGDEDLNNLDFCALFGKNIVIEEKVDGANVGVSFSENGQMLLQSRGHYLTGGYRERHYDLFKKWAYNAVNDLFERLGVRYVMYGEWLYAKHKIYYDNLPSYFLEFDIFDKETNLFLSTEKRRELLRDSGVFSVPVLAEGVFNNKEDILKYLTKSLYSTENARANLIETAIKEGLNVEEVLSESDTSSLSEGLYIKVEENGVVEERMKFVRQGYLQPQNTSTRWIDKPIIPNKLKN